MEQLDKDTEEIDVEEFAQNHEDDRKKPPARFYIIKVDKEKKRVGESQLTGSEILALVSKTSETHKLFQKFRGGRTEHVKPTEVVSFVAPGLERFQTIPMDTTEGGHNG